MTPQEIKTALNEICAICGPKAEASLSLGNISYGAGIVHVWCYPNGWAINVKSVDAWGNEFAEVIAKLRENVLAKLSDIHRATVRKMAMFIIEQTADMGECSEAALRANGFHQHQIETLGAIACEEAGKLAAGAPFSIIAANSNNPDAAIAAE